MNAFLDQLSKIGPARLIIMFGVAAGVAAALVAVSMGVGGTSRELLYSGLDMGEASEMQQQLAQAGFDVAYANGGSALMVEKGRALEARMILAAEGLPTSGSIGYEIFDTQDSFGTTQFVQNINSVRALQGELARSIQSLDGIASARVHLALPERRLFNRDAEAPKASVWVDLRQGELAARHARAIRNGVSSAVPGLSPSRVTILDQEGRVLARAEDGDEDAVYAMANEERRSGFEDRVRRQLVALIEPIVGPGAVEVQVSAEMDFNRVSETSTRYDPNGQVVVGTTTIERSANDLDREPDGAVSASNAIPGGEEPAGDTPTSQSASTQTEETINYENSVTTRTQIFEAGQIERISVAIAVDGATSVDEEGAVTWTPRSDEEMARIQALAMRAIGYDEARGDALEVANVRFSRLPPPTEASPAPSPFSFGKDDIMRGAELFVLTIVAAMIIFLVARPLVKSIPGGGGGPQLALAGAGAGAPAGAASIEMSEDLTLSQSGDGKGQAALPAPAEDDTISVAQIDGKVRASSVRKVAEIVESHPDETVSILRTWLHEG
ncbi:MAG: flagellar basal-body MS-ring/collar protein FliF [Maricaulaceae bacterium]